MIYMLQEYNLCLDWRVLYQEVDTHSNVAAGCDTVSSMMDSCADALSDCAQQWQRRLGRGKAVTRILYSE